MRMHYPSARVIPAGVNVDKIPFSSEHGDYLVFMGANVAHKQPNIAAEVAKKAGKEIRFIGPGFQEVSEAEKWKILGGALGLLCPYTIDASPRSPLEAAACGTPTLCLDKDGTKDHVYEGVTGHICSNSDEMAFWIEYLPDLSAEKMRAWVTHEHSNQRAARAIERLLMLVADGETW
jgi:glycosyltransferase involved in cell wall biosynthesis